MGFDLLHNHWLRELLKHTEYRAYVKIIAAMACFFLVD
jgi:hypothetical protein